MVANAELMKRGRFLLSRRTFRTNVIIRCLTWTSLSIILLAVLLQSENLAQNWWIVLVLLMNTIAVGLSHRELMQLTIEQEMEILSSQRVSKQNSTAPVSRIGSPQNDEDDDLLVRGFIKH